MKGVLDLDPGSSPCASPCGAPSFVHHSSTWHTAPPQTGTTQQKRIEYLRTLFVAYAPAEVNVFLSPDIPRNRLGASLSEIQPAVKLFSNEVTHVFRIGFDETVNTVAAVCSLA